MFNKLILRLMGIIRLLYCYIKWPSFYTNNIFVHPGSFLGKATSIGRGTNINGIAFIDSDEECKVIIGKYCAIARGLTIRVKNHAVNYPNMQLKLHVELGLEAKVLMKYKSKHVIIGHGCWIGDNVTILPGVNIGNGAVIASGSIVTKDVNDYDIVAGNPSKVIKKRISDCELLGKIKSIEWWNWNEKQMLANKDFFTLDFSQLDLLEQLKKFK